MYKLYNKIIIKRKLPRLRGERVQSQLSIADVSG